MFFRMRAALVPVLVVLGAATVPDAQSGGPFHIDKVEGRTGRFLVLLNERSPLSQPADVAKRTSQKVSPSEGDYDLKKEPFDTFVPKSPSDDGTYGLMIVMPLP